MTAPIRAGRRGGAARLGARLRRHELDGRGRPGGCRRRPDRARRGRSAQLRPVDAGGAEPDRGRPRSRRCSSAPTSARPRSSSAEGVPGRREVVGDVMADATRLFAPIARRREPPVEPPYVALTIHRQQNTEPDRLRAIVAALGESDRRFAFPVHPADAGRVLRGRRNRAAGERARARAARLPRDARAHRGGRCRRHRLRRPAEGGVLARRAVRDRAAEHRVGRHRRHGRKRARRARGTRARRSPRRASRPGPPRSTATATPPDASRPPCTLERRHGLGHRRHRCRLRRDAARADVRRGRARRSCSSTSRRRWSTRSTAARATSTTSRPRR